MYGQDVYSKPEDHGLEVIGAVDWDQDSYGFDFTVIWRDKETGVLYYADDSGCSCPSPFEDFNSKDELTETTPQELQLYLHKRNTDGKQDMDIANLMGRILN